MLRDENMYFSESSPFQFLKFSAQTLSRKLKNCIYFFFSVKISQSLLSKLAGNV